MERNPDTLRELADRMEIGELVARYAAAVDDRDYSAVVAFFTEDGTLSHPVAGDRHGRARGGLPDGVRPL